MLYLFINSRLAIWYACISTYLIFFVSISIDDIMTVHAPHAPAAHPILHPVSLTKIIDKNVQNQLCMQDVLFYLAL